MLDDLSDFHLELSQIHNRLRLCSLLGQPLLERARKTHGSGEEMAQLLTKVAEGQDSKDWSVSPTRHLLRKSRSMYHKHARKMY